MSDCCLTVAARVDSYGGWQVKAHVWPGEIRPPACCAPPRSDACCFIGSDENDEGCDCVESCWSSVRCLRVSAQEQRKIVGHSGFPVVWGWQSELKWWKKKKRRRCRPLFLSFLEFCWQKHNFSNRATLSWEIILNDQCAGRASPLHPFSSQVYLSQITFVSVILKLISLY